MRIFLVIFAHYSTFRMRQIVILLFFFQCSFGYSQETNSTKRSIKQDGLTIDCSVLEIGEKSKTIHYDYSKMYFWFKAQQIIATQGGSSGILLNGNYLAHYHENHQLYQSGSFSMGLKNGSWNQWRINGTLVSKERWKNGELKGKQLYFDSIGNLSKTICKLSFKTKTSSKDSIITQKKHVRKIQLIDASGNVSSTSKYRADKLHGKQVIVEGGKSNASYFWKGRQLCLKKKKSSDENPTVPKEKKRKKKQEAPN